MKIVYIAPEVKHNEDNITTFELATILEKKYHLLEKFTEDKQSKITNYVLTLIKRGGIDEVVLNEFIKGEWREWLIGGGSKIITQAAMERGDPSFIDTSLYYLSVQPQVIFNKKELELFKTLGNFR